MLSALMMFRRLAVALRIALREEDFHRVLGAALALIVVGTITYTLGADWHLADGFYVAVATLTTSSIMNPELTITSRWLEIFTAAYVLVGIGILVEVARRIGMGFIIAREELRAGRRRRAARSRRIPGEPAQRENSISAGNSTGPGSGLSASRTRVSKYT